MRELLGSLLRGLNHLAPMQRLGQSDSKIDVGSSFARLISSHVTETVRVTEVLTDGSGIPHIRFAVKLRDHNGIHDEGSRVLSQASFLSLYRKLS